MAFEDDPVMPVEVTVTHLTDRETHSVFKIYKFTDPPPCTPITWWLVSEWLAAVGRARGEVSV